MSLCSCNIFFFLGSRKIEIYIFSGDSVVFPVCVGWWLSEWSFCGRLAFLYLFLLSHSWCLLLIALGELRVRILLPFCLLLGAQLGSFGLLPPSSGAVHYRTHMWLLRFRSLPTTVALTTSRLSPRVAAAVSVSTYWKEINWLNQLWPRLFWDDPCPPWARGGQGEGLIRLSSPERRGLVG